MYLNCFVHYSPISHIALVSPTTVSVDRIIEVGQQVFFHSREWMTLSLLEVDEDDPRSQFSQVEKKGLARGNLSLRIF
jgi:hypothetical protein